MASTSNEISDEIDSLAKMVSPGHKGGEIAKEAILCAILGGVKLNHPDLGFIHPSLHILIIGEHGSGKTLLLQGIKSLDPKSQYSPVYSLCPLKPEIIPSEDGKNSCLVGVFPETTNGVLCLDDLNFATKDDIRAYRQVILTHKCGARSNNFSLEAPVNCATIASVWPETNRFQDEPSFRKNVALDLRILLLFDLIVILSSDLSDEALDAIFHDCYSKDGELDCRDAVIDRGIVPYISKCRLKETSFPPHVISMIDQYSPLLGTRVSTHSHFRLMGRANSIYKLAGAYTKLHEGNEVTLYDARRAIKLHNTCVQKFRETFSQ